MIVKFEWMKSERISGSKKYDISRIYTELNSDFINNPYEFEMTVMKRLFDCMYDETITRKIQRKEVKENDAF